MSLSPSQKLGAQGEDMAVRFLRRKGYKILARNYRKKWGEIDIVARHKKEIVFVEVKTIQKREGFYPEDRVDRKKENNLRKMAQTYLEENKFPLATPYQIDIIAIEIGFGFEEPALRHYENAISDRD